MAKYDWTKIKSMYLAGMTPAIIAQEIGDGLTAAIVSVKASRKGWVKDRAEFDKAIDAGVKEKAIALRAYGLETFRANLESDLAKIDAIVTRLETLGLTADKTAEQIQALRAAGQILLSKPDAYLDRIHRVGPPPKEIINLNKDIGVTINDAPKDTDPRPPEPSGEQTENQRDDGAGQQADPS